MTEHSYVVMIILYVCCCYRYLLSNDMMLLNIFEDKNFLSHFYLSIFTLQFLEIFLSNIMFMSFLLSLIFLLLYIQ